jgi:hypothetical protein
LEASLEASRAEAASHVRHSTAAFEAQALQLQQALAAAAEAAAAVAEAAEAAETAATSDLRAEAVRLGADLRAALAGKDETCRADLLAKEASVALEAQVFVSTNALLFFFFLLFFLTQRMTSTIKDKHEVVTKSIPSYKHACWFKGSGPRSELSGGTSAERGAARVAGGAERRQRPSPSKGAAAATRAWRGASGGRSGGSSASTRGRAFGGGRRSGAFLLLQLRFSVPVCSFPPTNE